MGAREAGKSAGPDEGPFYKIEQTITRRIMTSKIIKNGTVVTADLTYKADIRIENGVITEIGQNLSGGDTLDATGCYVMPGGIDPHTHLEMPFMGTDRKSVV